MAIQTLHDTGDDYKVTPKYDGGIYASGIIDCVCGGIGDEFALDYSANSLNVRFNAGSQAVIGGAFFKVLTLENVTLDANTTTYLCASIDLSKANGSRGSFEKRTSVIQKQNLNGDGVVRDLLLYVITTGTTGVTNVEDRRYIKSDGGASIGDLNQDNLRIVSNGGIPYLTTAPTSANTDGVKIVYLTSNPATKYDGYIYLIKE